MSRSRTLTLIGVVAGLALAVATSVGNAIKHVAENAYATCRAFKNLIVDNFMALAVTEPAAPKVAGYPQAKTYQARIEKRERPVLTNSWRMCPST